MRSIKFVLPVTILLFLSVPAAAQLNADKEIRYCARQAEQTMKLLPARPPHLPRSIAHDGKEWKVVYPKDWCSGFWPGILWELYQGTGDRKWRSIARKYTDELKPILQDPNFDHDLGFEIFCSYGNAYKSSGAKTDKAVILRAADSLATLFNPRVGTILSWPSEVKKKNWPHNTIIDNMMNLEMLFWASKNGGKRELYDIAVKHAETTLKNHFRDDHSAYHVVVYDTITGKKIRGVTHQGYNDNSMWARGQTWAIYGFTMCYRESRKKEFLDFAQKAANIYLQRLPPDLIPFWDFDDPAKPDAPKDVSAACIAASALLELSGYLQGTVRGRTYYQAAVRMLTRLSSAAYQSRDENSAFLLHSTGHKPAGSEIDASIIYADYYYLEALLRFRKIKNVKIN